MTQTATATSPPAATAAAPALRLTRGQAQPGPDECFARLRSFRGPTEAFLAELLGLQAALAGAVAGWVFAAGSAEPLAATGAVDAASTARAAALAAGEASPPGPFRLQPLAGPEGPVTVLRLPVPVAAGADAVTRERLALTATLYGLHEQRLAAERAGAGLAVAAIAAVAGEEASFEAGALALAAALVDRLGPGAQAAAVGWPGRGGRVRVAAIAPLTDADAGTSAHQALAAALAEASRSPLPHTDPAAALAAEALGTPAAAAVAARPGEPAAGPVLLLGFDPARLDPGLAAARLAAVAAAARGPLALLARADRPLAGRLPEALARVAVRGGVGRRVVAAALAVALGAVALVPVPATVRAGFTAEADGARTVAAAAEGQLASVAVMPGDAVRAGVTVLGTLATDELRLERATLLAERSTHRREADDTRGHDPTASRLAELEVERLDAAIALADHRIAAARLVSPISGVVTSPDLHPRIGTPVTRGETLFEVADPARLTAAVAVPEAVAHRVRVGARGRLRPASHPGVSLPVTVTRLSPRGEATAAGTVFRVEVAFDRVPGWLKEGSRGQARIDAGHAPLLGQWVGPTLDALRLHMP
ncbi:efflux RND transporter periplasmic adaptor subunit [Phycisphaera mikurensis]|uniref:Uncharacterized protein n=1 Tax=Phycisphaera mikurensis (strain NBRC 102666 / KCTC 22515 / FYK2301M01) TaxID=1142394 RepID=I0ICD5_PHYMF|nr:HlyD family efflux transporter periplasmic adaptor subunit [Phycisphaera mikurensis]MBB6442199.1 hypothetical protein [Phycisphaera mikurensis]BAM02923.1 hypothetical protein PSMK_07640 [Phycisphaera mikurensis NBRC 102666]